MSKESITYSCGHDGVVAIWGNKRDRARTAARLAEEKCPQCQNAERLAQYAAESAAATEKAKQLGLPELIGSPKQVAWAESIRAKALASPDNDVTRIDELADDATWTISRQPGIGAADIEMVRCAVRDAALAAANELLTQDSAKWWIDNSYVTDRWVGEAAKNTRRHYSQLLKAATEGRGEPSK